MNVQRAVVCGLLCLLAVIIVPAKADPDLWGHIRFGLDVWQQRDLQVVDPYSFTQDRPQLYHEWLGAVLLGLSYTIAGVPGLLILKSSIAFGVIAVLAGWLRRLSPADASILAILAAWSMLPITSTIRPQLWTVLAMVTLVRLLLEARWWWIPPLFALWANLHGGWVMGLGILGIWCASTIVDTWWRTGQVPWRPVFLPIAALASTLLTPYGWHLWQFLGETVRVARLDISEWHPVWEQLDYPVVPALLTAGWFVVVSLHRGARLSWPWFVVAGVFLYSGVRVSRLMSIATVVLILLTAVQLARRTPRPTWWIELPSRVAVLIMMVPVSIMVAVAFLSLGPSFRCLQITGSWAPDRAAIPVLQQGVDGGRIVTFFDWGEYALWHLGPRLKISMDGRRETIYSDRMLAIHRAIYSNGAEGDEWLVEQRPEYVWLKAQHQPRKQWLLAHGYRLDWESRLSYVAVRADLPQLTGPPTLATAGCFPGP